MLSPHGRHKILLILCSSEVKKVKNTGCVLGSLMGTNLKVLLSHINCSYSSICVLCKLLGWGERKVTYGKTELQLCERAGVLQTS